MNFQLTLSLLTSIMLLTLSAWNLNTFLRLNNASKNYVTNQDFEDSCHTSKTYSKGGLIIAITMTVLSIIIFIMNLVVAYKNL